MAKSYATPPDLKGRLDIDDGDDDTYLAAILEAVSRSVDDYTGRRFYTTTADETRVYTATRSDLFESPDDIISITTLKTDTAHAGTFDRTWAAADYELWPYNASLDSVPYTEIRAATDSTSNGYTFPTWERGLQIVGKFGYWTSIPVVVKEVTIVESMRLYHMNETPSGVIVNQMGVGAVVPALHPTSRAMLAPFVRMGVHGF